MKFKKTQVFFSLIALIVLAGCGGGGGETQTGTAGHVSDTLLGSGNGTVSIYAKSDDINSPSASASAKNTEKTVSYGGGTVTTFDIEIVNIILRADDGSTATIAVNSTVHLADPDYSSYINFLTDQSVPAGNYTGVDCELGTVSFVATGISPDPTDSIEAYSNQTVSLDISFSITTDGDLALPLVLDLETILSQGFSMSVDTPFAVRVSILPLLDGGSIWTTGDMIGFADDSGSLYAIDDSDMSTPIGSYTQLTDTTGTYIFTAGTYIGIQGSYVINPGGTFSGDANGFFTLNGNYDGGYWVTDASEYGTFTLTSGWVPNGTGTYDGLTTSTHGTITLNDDASGGTWEESTGDSSGTFELD